MLILVAGGLLWLNIGLASFGMYGWPISMFSYTFTYFDYGCDGYHNTPTQDNVVRLIFNVLFCLFLFFAVAFILERRQRNALVAPKVLSLILLLVVGGISLLWNFANPVDYYYHAEEDLLAPALMRRLSLTAPVLMRLLSMLAVLFLTRFASEIIGLIHRCQERRQ